MENEHENVKLDSWDPRQKGFQRSNASAHMEGAEVTPSKGDLIWPHLARPKIAKEKELETRISGVSESWMEDEVPYDWGKKSRNGADCSGSVWSIYNEAGYPYPYQNTSGFGSLKEFRTLPSGAELRVGDVVHYGGHMAVYAGKGSSGSDMVWSARGNRENPGKPFMKTEMMEFGKPQKFYRYNLR